MRSAEPSDYGRVDEVAWGRERVSRIVLGTVQLGMDYGIANTSGKPVPEKAKEIVETAWQRGIRYFDTAQAYGDSEEVLGQAFRLLGIQDDVCVTTKLTPYIDPANIHEIRAAIERSFELLGVERLWCLLLHDPVALEYWDQGLGELLHGYRESGRILHLGASLFTPEQSSFCVPHPSIEVLQVAANAWDRRMNRLGVFEQAKANSQLCCVRSIYLKGLLTLSPEEAAARLPVAHEASVRWHELAARLRIPPVELAVRYALWLELPLVVGAEAPEQVIDTVRLARKPPLTGDIVSEIARELDPLLNDNIVQPRNWEKG